MAANDAESDHVLGFFMNRLFRPAFLLLLAHLLFLQVHALVASQAGGVASISTQQPMLNSERIRTAFGSYGLGVLEQDEHVRVANLYSIEQGKKITRTLAVVIYADEIPPQILVEHKIIAQGGSIGEVFKNNGWRVEKTGLYFGEIQASPDFAEIYSLMGGIEPVNLAVHLYGLSVCKADLCFEYASIAEVHHPDYLGLVQLKTIYITGDEGLNAGSTKTATIMNTVTGQLRLLPIAR